MRTQLRVRWISPRATLRSRRAARGRSPPPLRLRPRPSRMSERAFAAARARAACVRAVLGARAPAAAADALICGSPASGVDGRTGRERVAASAAVIGDGLAVGPATFAQAVEGACAAGGEVRVEVLVSGRAAEDRWLPACIVGTVAVPASARAARACTAHASAQRVRFGWVGADGGIDGKAPPLSAEGVTSLCVLTFSAANARIADDYALHATLVAGQRLALVASPFASVSSATAARFHLSAGVMATVSDPHDGKTALALLDTPALPGAQGAPAVDAATGALAGVVAAAPLQHVAAGAETLMLLPAEEVLKAVHEVVPRLASDEARRTVTEARDPRGTACAEHPQPAWARMAARAVHRACLDDGRWGTAVALSSGRHFTLPAHLFGDHVGVRRAARQGARLWVEECAGSGSTHSRARRRARLVRAYPNLDLALGELEAGEPALPLLLTLGRGGVGARSGMRLAAGTELRAGAPVAIAGYPLLPHERETAFTRGELSVVCGRGGGDSKWGDGTVGTSARLYEGGSGSAILLVPDEEPLAPARSRPCGEADAECAVALVGIALGNITHERRGHEPCCNWAAGPALIRPLAELVDPWATSAARRRADAELSRREAIAARSTGPYSRL